MRMLPRIFLSLTSLPSRVSRVYGQQAFLDKFPLKRFVAHVHGILLNRFMAHVKAAFRSPFVCAPVKFSLAATHEQIYFPCPKASTTRAFWDTAPWQGKYFTRAEIKIVKENVSRKKCPSLRRLRGTK